MPRFENKGFNPEKRNKNNDLDRTVPIDENYYGYSPIDLNFNDRQRNNNNPVRDNQGGINPCNDFDNNDHYNPTPNNFYTQPKRNNIPQHFVSESANDFDRTPTGHPKRQTAKSDKPQKGRKSNQPDNAKKSEKGKRPKLSVGKQILLFILVLVLIIIGSVSVVMGRVNYNDKSENTSVSASSLQSSSMVKNILLLGVDARAGEEGDQTRSDTMMLISLDMKHHCIKMISFLRDTWVYIPSLGYEQRLNAACSSGGYSGVVDAIEYNFGIDIDGYAVVDFEMFKVLVDSLGGVEVDVTEAEANEVTNNPYRYDYVTLDAGKYKLSGEQALAYCRIRKIDTDFVRTERQRTVMNAILTSAKHSNPFKLYKMAFNSAPYIETDLGKGELVKLAIQAATCITGDFHQTKVPFEGTWSYATIKGNSVISIDTQENKDMLIDYIYNKSSSDIKTEETAE